MESRADLVARLLDLEMLVKSQVMSGQMGTAAAAHLSMHQFRALVVVLEQGAMPTSVLADRLGVKPNVATGIVQRLVDRGLACREPDPADRRIVKVALSDEGAELMHEAAETLTRDRTAQMERLSEAQMASYVDILTTIANEPGAQ